MGQGLILGPLVIMWEDGVARGAVFFGKLFFWDSIFDTFSSG